MAIQFFDSALPFNIILIHIAYSCELVKPVALCTVGRNSTIWSGHKQTNFNFIFLDEELQRAVSLQNA